MIPCILLKGDLVVQSYFFKRYLPIGNVKTAIEFFVNWDVDEIVILDIDATKNNRGPRLDIIEFAARECFVPLTVGGGIKSIEDIKNVLNAGADKICLNSYTIKNPKFITEAAQKLGAQGVTVSIDAKKVDGKYQVFSTGGKVNENISVLEWAKECEARGAGEILLNSIDRDGSRKGYDIDLLSLVSEGVKIPVIACGGVGKVDHLSEGVIKGGCQAVAAANIFQHTEHSTIAAKAHMKNLGLEVRLNTHVKYQNFSYDHLGRPL